jgi:hypothetical protein
MRIVRAGWMVYLGDGLWHTVTGKGAFAIVASSRSEHMGRRDVEPAALVRR